MGNRAPRVISDSDRAKIWRTLNTHANAGSLAALRTRAVVILTCDTSLRLSEMLALDCAQLLEDTSSARPRIVSELHLHPTQAKGRKRTKERAGYSSARLVILPRRARAAVLAYLRRLRALKILPSWKGSPWIASIEPGKGETRRPVKERAIQHAWREWQTRAGVRDPYRWHDLRHTAITRWAGTDGADVFAVAELAGHANVRTTQGYVHHDPKRLAAIANAASEA